MRSTVLAGLLATLVAAAAAPSGAEAVTRATYPDGAAPGRVVSSLAPRSTPMQRVKAYPASGSAHRRKGHRPRKPSPGA